MQQSFLSNFGKEENTENPIHSEPVTKANVLQPTNTKTTKTVASKESTYDTEYLCQLISKDLSILDIRSWPRGINRKEFDAFWENNFVPIGDDPWFAGHFAFAVREAKRHFRADKEKVWEQMLKCKKSQLERWMQIYRRDAEDRWKTANTSNTPADVEYWLKHCHTTWSELHAVLKELGLPEEPLPEKYKIAFCDPMKWGEEKKPETTKTIRKRREKVQNASVE